MEKVAKWKLLSGRRHVKHDFDNKNYVFTTLSFCITLDVWLENLVSLLFIQTAVYSDLKVIITMDQSIGILYTVTFSESILALATMKLLCKRNN